MISLTEQLTLSQSAIGNRQSAIPLSPELAARVHENDLRLVAKWRDWLCAPVQLLRPSEWLAQNITLNTAAARNKRWSFEGREYIREQIDQIENPECRFLTSCGGTGSGKTLRDYGIMLYKMVHRPFPGLYIMPASTGPGGATSICRELQQTLDASADPRFHPAPPFLGRLPVGAARKGSLTRTRIEFGGNDLDFVGAHSANQVGNKRCTDVGIGEQDKTKESIGREAGTDYLAGERTKGMSNTLIFRGSTPSLEGFGIWKALMGNGDSSGSDCRRRFLPCPHCNPQITPISADKKNSPENLRSSAPSADNLKGWFVLIKDAQYNTALPTKLPDGTPIPFAELRWDKEAKRKDGTWDMDRVIKSARFECPHCGGHVRDEHRLWLDKNGVWIHTRRGEPGHYGYQLASFYAPLVKDDYGQINFDSTWGGMAQKFLNAIENGTIGGYINSDLAEVNANQNNATSIELTSAPMSQPDWVAILTADFHKNWPLVWFVVRKWCAFKLLPPFPVSNGVPNFVELLELPGNEMPRNECLDLIDEHAYKNIRDTFSNPAWLVIAELMRFKSGESKSPMIEFLLAQKITGKKLVKLFREDAKSDTMQFRKLILWEMSKQTLNSQLSTLATFRPARGGDSELLAAGYCELSGEAVWDELRDIEKEFHVGQGMTMDKRCVLIDSGYQENFEREVLRKCYESATHYKWYDPLSRNSPPQFHGLWQGGERPSPAKHIHCLPTSADGWLALRGVPTNRPLGDGKINHELSIRCEDPFYGTADAGSKMVEVLNVPQGLFWLRKNDLLLKRTKNVFGISPKVTFFPKIYLPDGTRTDESRVRLADYEKHINEQFYDEKKGKVEPRHGRGGAQNKRHPYHLDDCETYQVAAATHHEFFQTSEVKK